MKTNLRVQFKQKLESFDFFSLIDKSSRLSDQFFRFSLNHSNLFKNRYVVSFYPFDAEPQLNIEIEGQGEPYRVAYVRIDHWGNRVMSAHAARRDLPDQWEEFEIRPEHRIFQPRITQPLCGSSEIAAILVPGLAFTRDGKRLGRGAGFYDRFLNLHPEALRIGVAFEEQIAPSLPVDKWDENLDVILTDQSFYSMKTYEDWKIHGKLLDRSL